MLLKREIQPIVFLRMISINKKYSSCNNNNNNERNDDVRNKNKSIYNFQMVSSPYDTTLDSRLMSSVPNSNIDERSSYDIEYSNTTITNRADLIGSTPFSYMYQEKQEFFDERLNILRQQAIDIKLNKLLVYIALEYVLNCNPNPILIKNIYDNLDKNNKEIINGNILCDYFEENKNILIEHLNLNDINQDIQISHCCQWKLTQIFTLYKTNKIVQNQYKTLKSKYNVSKKENKKLKFEYDECKQNLQRKQNELNEIKLQNKNRNRERNSNNSNIMPVPITRTRNLTQPMIKTKISKYRRKKSSKTSMSRRSRSDSTKTKEAIITWKKYTDRLLYIKQRYPTECMNRNKAWEKWSKLLNDIEESGKIDNSTINHIWQYIDFARMSLGRYTNWIWCPNNPQNYKQNSRKIEWTKRYIVLMDFNLFLFDNKCSPKSIKQTLSFKHELLSISSIESVISSKENIHEFELRLNANNCIKFRCDDAEIRQGIVDEISYQIKCIHDLLKIPNIRLKPADPDKNIWLPIPIGFDK